MLFPAIAFQRRSRVQATISATRHSGSVTTPLIFKAIEILQGENKLYLFKAKASILYAALSINPKTEEGEEGYQRARSNSRVRSVTRYIQQKKPIPGAIIVCFDSATFDYAKGELVVPAGKDVGWVIDGQHRLAGAEMAAQSGIDIELPVVSFIGLSEISQIEQYSLIKRC